MGPSASAVAVGTALTVLGAMSVGLGLPAARIGATMCVVLMTHVGDATRYSLLRLANTAVGDLLEDGLGDHLLQILDLLERAGSLDLLDHVVVAQAGQRLQLRVARLVEVDLTVATATSSLGTCTRSPVKGAGAQPVCPAMMLPWVGTNVAARDFVYPPPQRTIPTHRPPLRHRATSSLEPQAGRLHARRCTPCARSAGRASAAGRARPARRARAPGRSRPSRGDSDPGH